MALSLFVEFNQNRQNILLAQGLLMDESLDSHAWMFKQIIKATNIQPTVILTDSDLAVNAAIRKVFQTTYPIHCVFYIMQNIHKNLYKQLGNQYEKFFYDFYNCKNSFVQETFQNHFIKLLENYSSGKHYLEVLYKSKEYWAHLYKAFKFTRGMIFTSHVEAMNACLKKLLYNSNVSLCELMFEIHRLLDQQDKQNLDKCCQEFLISEILNMQHDEINQSLYYVAYLVNKQDVLFSKDLNATLSNDENQSANDLHATIHQLLGVVDFDNINEIWKQRFIYRHLHDAYKIALQKALSSKSKSCFIKILQEFTDKDDELSNRSSDEEYSQDNSSSDKKNGSISLQNLKKQHNRRRPL
ncbi:9576_t:CDS:2, partial [Cetraspora pellucida]